MLDHEGFVSALARANVRDPSWRCAGDPPLEVQLDHFATEPKSFDLEHAEVRKEGRSDHFPIVASFPEHG